MSIDRRLLYNRNRLLLDKADNTIARVGNVSKEASFDVAGYACVLVGDQEAERLEQEGWRWTGLRECYGIIPDDLWRIAAKGSELMWWESHSRFCPVCGTRMDMQTDISRRCPVCGYESWPYLSPAVLVLVTRGEEALLVHAANFRRDMHALVAGFVETGETLEECVAREVREETSLEVTDVRYFASQSWPFPSQMMIGFTARWKSGEIRFADGELTSGAFFRRDSVPPLPTLPSLSRRMIDAWLSGRLP